jgi:dienelactone hydrolase
VERAAIPVERTEGPVLLFSGRDDQVWPSARLAEISMERLSRYEHPYPYEHVCYREARHLISLPYLPTTSQRTCRSAEEHEPIFGGTPEADAAASADSWTRTLIFLAKL